MSQLLRVQCFNVSRDGFGAGEGQSLERPFGHADPADLFSWAGATASWPNRTDPGGTRGLDDYFTRDFDAQHRRRDHGPQQVRPPARPVGGPRLEGLVGRQAAVPHAGVRAHPPRAPVVHAVRHHVPLPRRHARPRRCAQAKEAADGKDVRLGGGVATVREFLDADLVDTMHVAVAPIEIGRGERLWESHDELLDRFHLESVPSPSGVTHLLFWRR